MSETEYLNAVRRNREQIHKQTMAKLNRKRSDFFASYDLELSDIERFHIANCNECSELWASKRSDFKGFNLF
jgi:formylmethanofuran dehydrogenase subunit E